ncbi:MAG: hypothetical protein IPO27_12480 [Bacteroidetes bacterium]|nr:hypothetical protein [Bacteroidota bacterium]
MNWKLIILLSSPGVIMGLLSVLGYTHKIEIYLWICFAIATALILARNTVDRLFVHALLIGIIWGLLNAICQKLFFDMYFKNNAQLHQAFSKSTWVPPHMLPLVSGPVIGLIAGLVLAAMSFVARKLF